LKIGAELIQRLENLLDDSNGEIEIHVGYPSFASAVELKINAPGYQRLFILGLYQAKKGLEQEFEYL
jgi:hypothetical protein